MKHIFAVLVIISSILYGQFSLGDGSDGALIVEAGDTFYVDSVSSNLAEDAIAGSLNIFVNDSFGFEYDDEILIWTSTDSNFDPELNTAGIYEFARIIQITENNLGLNNPLQQNYIIDD